MNWLQRITKRCWFFVNQPAANRYLQEIGDYLSDLTEINSSLSDVADAATGLVFLNLYLRHALISEKEATARLYVLNNRGAAAIKNVQVKFPKLRDPADIFLVSRQIDGMRKTLYESKIFSKSAYDVFLAASALADHWSGDNTTDQEALMQFLTGKIRGCADQRIRMIEVGIRYMDRNHPSYFYRTCLLAVAKIERLILDLSDALSSEDKPDSTELIRQQTSDHVAKLIEAADEGIQVAQTCREKIGVNLKLESRRKAYFLMESLEGTLRYEKEIAKNAEAVVEAENNINEFFERVLGLEESIKNRASASANRVKILKE